MMLVHRELTYAWLEDNKDEYEFYVIGKKHKTTQAQNDDKIVDIIRQA